VERELIVTGIGGQGIQLAAAVVARAAVDEGREAQVFGSYGGMMRGGSTESTIVIADGAIVAPPTVGETWSAILMHHEHARHALACLRPGSLVFVNSTVVADHGSLAERLTGEGCTVFEVPASDMGAEVGHVMTGSMVMVGAYAAATGLVQLPSLVTASSASLPSYRAQHVELNERALRVGFDSVPQGTVPAWPASVEAAR